MMKCKATNAAGQPCRAVEGLVGPNGLCRHHDPDLREEMRAVRSAGGKASTRKAGSSGLDAEDIVALTSLEDAKLALDQIRRAVLCRQITHSEGASATKAISEWVRAESALLTQRLVNELEKELAAKASEIEALRGELARAKVRAV